MCVYAIHLKYLNYESNSQVIPDSLAELLFFIKQLQDLSLMIRL